MLKKIFEMKFFITNIFIPLAVLAIYCISFVYFSTRFLPQGVNYVFANKLWKYLVPVLIGSYFIFFVVLKFNKTKKISFENSIDRFSISDFLLVLLPLSPVVQYMITNHDILSLQDSLYVLFFFTLLSGFFIILIPEFLGIVSSTRTLRILGLAFVFTITSMALLSQQFKWFETGSLKIQIVFFGGVFLITLLLYNLKNKWILYIPILAFFLSNSLIQLMSQNYEVVNPTSSLENKLLKHVEGKKPKVFPNIYLILYDAYVPNETMMGYGIDNKSQEDFLQEKDFKLYPHTYSVGGSTLTSMSSVFDVTNNLEDKKDKRIVVAGNGIVQGIFKNLGYKTFGVFPNEYMFRGVGPHYDTSIPEYKTPPYIYLSSAILIGEFRFDLGFDSQSHNEFVKTKQSILESVSTNHVFLYSHTNIPTHSQNSGTCLPNEIDLFKERLDSANIEMREDVKIITEHDPDAIIIVAGDHGPHITKNCTVLTDVKNISEISRMDIQDRYASFLAIRWPTKNYTQYDEITVLQDTFPAIFAYLYEDKSILDSKIKPEIMIDNIINGANVKNGIISGGINDGEPLFLSKTQ